MTDRCKQTYVSGQVKAHSGCFRVGKHYGFFTCHYLSHNNSINELVAPSGYSYYEISLQVGRKVMLGCTPTQSTKKANVNIETKLLFLLSLGAVPGIVG